MYKQSCRYKLSVYQEVQVIPSTHTVLFNRLLESLLNENTHRVHEIIQIQLSLLTYFSRIVHMIIKIQLSLLTYFSRIVHVIIQIQ